MQSPNQKNYVDNHPPCTKWRVPWPSRGKPGVTPD